MLSALCLQVTRGLPAAAGLKRVAPNGSASLVFRTDSPAALTLQTNYQTLSLCWLTASILPPLAPPHSLQQGTSHNKKAELETWLPSRAHRLMIWYIHLPYCTGAPHTACEAPREGSRSQPAVLIPARCALNQCDPPLRKAQRLSASQALSKPALAKRPEQRPAYWLAQKGRMHRRLNRLLNTLRRLDLSATANTAQVNADLTSGLASFPSAVKMSVRVTMPMSLASGSTMGMRCTCARTTSCSHSPRDCHFRGGGGQCCSCHLDTSLRILQCLAIRLGVCSHHLRD